MIQTIIDTYSSVLPTITVSENNDDPDVVFEIRQCSSDGTHNIISVDRAQLLDLIQVLKFYQTRYNHD